MKLVVAALAVLFVICSVNSQLTCENALYKNPPTNSLMSRVMPIKEKQHQECRDAGMCPEVVASQGPASCVGGMAGVYPCNNVDLVSFVSLSDLGSSGNGNDIWGWTDPAGGNEIVIACCEDGTSFVDISNPTSPVVLGYLPTETTSTVWRDAKVYKNHAYIVSEAADHGMQVVDLTSLRSLYGNTNTKPVTLSPLTVYTGFGSAHNIVINEESGYAYAVGTKVCDGGLHVVDISDPANPVCAGCYWQDGYVHDAQCINYVNGPDANFNGKEICFCYNEDTLTIVDVTNKLNMVEVARVPYSGSQYTHQGWLSEDMTHLFMNDELDEVEGSTGGPTNGQNTRTLIWDVTDLTKPVWVNTFFSERTVIDHNLYVNNTLVFEANYCGGLRILRTLRGLPGKPPLLREVGFFDVAPNCDEVRFFGAWSNYPYFGSGNIVVQSIERGLFVVKPTRYIA